MEQIQRGQQAIPIEMFTGWAPSGVAGMSPMQQFALSNLIPATYGLPAGAEGLLQLGGPISQIANAILGLTPTSSATQSALGILGPRLGGPATVPQVQPPNVGGGFQPNIPTNATAFPGLTAEEAVQLGQSTAAQGGIPNTPFVSAPPPPLQPYSVPTGPPAAPPNAANDPLIAATAGMNSEQIRLFQMYIASGVPPDEARSLATQLEHPFTVGSTDPHASA